MPNVDRLKRQMLREAVRENLDVIEGRPPAGPGRTAAGRRLAVRALAAPGRPPRPPRLDQRLLRQRRLLARGRRRAAADGRRRRRPSPALENVAWPAPRSIDPTLFHLDVKTVVLDAGHGGSDPGALTADGLLEKEITLDLAERVAGKLRGGLFQVVMTRSGDETLSLRERSRRAREAGGDVLVSIHLNSIPRPDRRGIETYYLGPTDDPAIRELAGAENRSSGYSLADFRGLLEGVYVDVRQAESRRLAESVQGELVSSLRKSVTPGRGPGREERSVRRPHRLRDAGDPRRGLLPLARRGGAPPSGHGLSGSHRGRARAGRASLRGFAEPRGSGKERERMSGKKDVLHVGIDLGTSRSAIAASNGAAPRRGELRRLARRHGRAQGREEGGPLRARGPREPADARPPPPAGAGPHQGGLGEGRGGGPRAPRAPHREGGRRRKDRPAPSSASRPRRCASPGSTCATP